MSDLIDRDEVIEIIESVCSADDTYWEPGTLEKIRNLPTHPTPSNTLGALDCVDRAEVIKAVKFYETFCDPYPRVIEALEELPSAQLERDIPIKPIETTDRAWGIPHKQAVCPKCDYYLSHISFLGDYKGKRITYCETCGQAIDWEGWDWNE